MFRALTIFLQSLNWAEIVSGIIVILIGSVIWYFIREWIPEKRTQKNKVQQITQLKKNADTLFQDGLSDEALKKYEEILERVSAI